MIASEIGEKPLPASQSQPQSLPLPLPLPLPTTFFVMERSNGHWSLDAKLLTLFDNEPDATTAAVEMHGKFTEKVYGVFSLIVEVRRKTDITDVVRN